jgi:hypothetical protein
MREHERGVCCACLADWAAEGDQEVRDRVNQSIQLLIVYSKRTGLEKAVYRIEQALEKSQANGGRLDDEQAAHHLQQLLAKTANVLMPSPMPRQSVSSVAMSSMQQPDQDSYALEDAENPLQLLARASDLPVSPHASSTTLNDKPTPGAPTSHPTQRPSNGANSDLKTFFGPLTPNLDIGEDIDPIDLGLVTLQEADYLFSYFYANLSHTRWGLDSALHTSPFVRSRSAFLFTSILSASALFLPSCAALSKRLSDHCRTLAMRAIERRNRSPEIVLAFMVNIPWMTPGRHWADDQTCVYLAMALTVAMDLWLNKLAVPSPSEGLRGKVENIPSSECISARKALALDGFEDVDPNSLFGRRLLRRRERIWLALFVLDRGVNLARGRPMCAPVTALTEHCDEWHGSELADVWDEAIVSSATLRRNLAGLITNIIATCDNDQSPTVAQT